MSQASLFAPSRPSGAMTPEQHLRALAEFVRAVELAGGTTPHMLMAVEAARRQDEPLEQLWWLGCYALAYNWPTADIIYRQWRPGEALDSEGFERWARENWAGIALRKERKAVRSPEKLAASASSYAAYAQAVTGKEWFRAGGEYEAAFQDFCGSCAYMGRYIAIRWLEAVRLLFDLPNLEMPDLRPEGGSHPRKALALIYPKEAEALLGGDSPFELSIAHRAAARCMEELAVRYGVRTNYYELQSLLCEYKQSALARKQFPGKSIETEVDYFDRIYAHWGSTAAEESEFWSVRERCFPRWALGEHGGWRGVRKALGCVLVDYGYTWSDAVYSWRDTEHLAAPALRPGGLPSILPEAA